MAKAGIEVIVYHAIPRAVGKNNRRSPDNETVTLAMILPAAMDAFNGIGKPAKIVSKCIRGSLQYPQNRGSAAPQAIEFF